MGNELKIEIAVMRCPICKDRATQGVTCLWDGKGKIFEGCTICFHRMLDENPMAKVLHAEWQMGVDQIRDHQDQLEGLAEFLLAEVNHLSTTTGPHEAAKACILRLKAELELYETEGVDGVKSQRDFLLGRLRAAKLKDFRGLFELAIDFFPEEYQNRVAKANGRLAELIYSEKELRAEVRAPKKDRVWKEGNGV